MCFWSIFQIPKILKPRKKLTCKTIASKKNQARGEFDLVKKNRYNLTEVGRVHNLANVTRILVQINYNYKLKFWII
jgi:hypothetical protein